MIHPHQFCATISLHMPGCIRLHLNPPEHPEQGVADDGKLRAVGIAYRLFGLRLDGKRIDGRAVIVNAEIEVRARRQARASHITDDFLLLHFRPHLDAFGETRQVHIRSGIPAVMAYLQVIARTARLIRLGYHLSLSDGIDGRAFRSGIVNPMVSPVPAQYRMETAVRETGRNAVIVQRSLQKIGRASCRERV